MDHERLENLELNGEEDDSAPWYSNGLWFGEPHGLWLMAESNARAKALHRRVQLNWVIRGVDLARPFGACYGSHIHSSASAISFFPKATGKPQPEKSANKSFSLAVKNQFSYRHVHLQL